MAYFEHNLKLTVISTHARYLLSFVKLLAQHKTCQNQPKTYQDLQHYFCLPNPKLKRAQPPQLGGGLSHYSP